MHALCLGSISEGRLAAYEIRARPADRQAESGIVPLQGPLGPDSSARRLDVAPLRFASARVRPRPSRDESNGRATTMRLRVIPRPAPGTRTVLMKGSAPVFTGSGATTCLCGACGLALAKKTSRGQVCDFVIKCPGCGSFNELP